MDKCKHNRNPEWCCECRYGKCDCKKHKDITPDLIDEFASGFKLTSQDYETGFIDFYNEY